MAFGRVGWCFLLKPVAESEVVEALRTYEPLGNAAFVPTPDGITCSGPGFAVLIKTVVDSEARLLEIDKVGRRQEQLRQSCMVLTLDAWIDEDTYQGTVYSVKAPMGPEHEALPWEAVGACEALNINLADSRLAVYDHSGFYPTE